MPRWAWNKASSDTKRRYFELIRSGMSGQKAAALVGVSASSGSNWYIDAGSMTVVEEKPISSRYLSQDDRIEIADGIAVGEAVKSIAARIGKSYQSVYKEIARNRRPGGRYQPWYAHNQAFTRRRRPKPRVLETDPKLARIVACQLAQKWSPGQISRWLRRRYPHLPAWWICPETIYEAIYHGRIILPATTRQCDSPLRTGRTYRHQRGRGRSKDGALRQHTAMRSIHDRPAAVEARTQIGHWEGDLIIGAGQRSAIATLVDRKTRTTMLVALPDGHSATVVADALVETFSALPPHLRRTLTWDQGNELFQHERIEQSTGLRIYFADPHSPWQRPSNENTNGLLRQYFPKGTDLSVHTQEHLDTVAVELNDRPRACLNDRTPAQLMRTSTRRAKTSSIRFVR
ncbi:IS30 family transposase [Promicromonospora aerolata]|uniref:IS30 family transposase n=1 Tax=Promicromonospora aerolata TaxID=195749 RepID=A0ABW4V2X6_9MICO